MWWEDAGEGKVVTTKVVPFVRPRAPEVAPITRKWCMVVTTFGVWKSLLKPDKIAVIAALYRRKLTGQAVSWRSVTA